MRTVAAPLLAVLCVSAAGAQAPALPRRSGLPLETFPGVEVVYTAIRNPRGLLQRAIMTRPERSTGRRAAILFVPWLSCDSVESPKGAAPGIDELLQRIASTNQALAIAKASAATPTSRQRSKAAARRWRF